MKTTGRVNGIISNIVIVKADGPVGQNEICYVYAGDTKMMAEVIKVMGDAAYVQVFDSTRGLKIGDSVEFEGHMLEATLAPGLLSRNYDGLQNDLEKMDGLFIARGSMTEPVDFGAEWEFAPLAKEGDKVSAASWLGEVKEQWLTHKIMVPFTMTDTYTVKSVAAAGKYKITDTMAVVVDAEGREHNITMVQKWPVKQAVRCYTEKPRPSRVMETGVRAIDTFNPMAEGGTGFIPGPFGAGKTVLQHAISKQADADVIIMVACGERANEVVEIFKEFPELVDPRTGHKLMERTIIICNTSNMPVAAREASVYTGMTIGEYYRAMGLKVLVMADSTSRWAQALREMSNRLEELPGQDAFPMDLSAIISNFYSRAGLVKLSNGATGSVTFLGTVSPAGGNLKEPVTEVQARGTMERPTWLPTGSFRWPTSGTITSRYGYRNIFGGSSFHSGIDIANSYGTDIVAADGGEVIYAGWMSGYGYLVQIDHQNGYVTYYGHNSSLEVSVGDKVYKGQHIAEMGSTGRSTGNHLHFEVRVNGNRRDPLDYFKDMPLYFRSGGKTKAMWGWMG